MAHSAPSMNPTSHIAKRLPTDFLLGDNDVYVGRVNVYRYHPGNERFHELVLANVERYFNASKRNEKTSIIYEIIDNVRARSPNGGFVKFDTKSGRWYEVGDVVAREKTSQAFRDSSVGINKSNRVLKSSKGEIKNSSGDANQVIGCSPLATKRSFSDICNDTSILCDSKPPSQQHNVNDSEMIWLYEKNTALNESFVISQSNQIKDDAFIEPLHNFTEYRKEKSSQSSDGSCGESTTTTVDELVNIWDTDVANCTFMDPSVPVVNEGTIYDPLMLIRHPSTTTTPCIDDDKTENVKETAADSGATSETTSDEETFDRLVKLYESWK